MDDLRQRAVRAYELGLLRAALPWAVPGVAMGIAGVWLGSPLAVPMGSALTGTLVFLRWRGQDLGRGVPVGLQAGSLVFAVVALWCMQRGGCDTRCLEDCLAVSLAAGVGGGALLVRGLRGASVERSAAALLVASLVLAVVAANLGIAVLATVALLVLAPLPVVRWESATA